MSVVFVIRGLSTLWQDGFDVIASSALIALLTQCAPGIATDTMQAVVMAESKGNPLRINVNSGGRLLRQPQSETEAIDAARSLIAIGASFDVGLAQVNSLNFSRLGLTPENAFQPCRNVAAGAAILAENYRTAIKAGHPAPLSAALSLYNTGSMSRGISNGYVERVREMAGAPHHVAVPDRSGRSVDPDIVSHFLLAAFGGRITDTWRPQNAAYGAYASFHKAGQAVDFVPAEGVHAISKAEIEQVLTAQGITILELLGPGDPGHDNHWHVAFSRARTVEPPEDHIVVPGSTSSTSTARKQATPPPSWDIFAVNLWNEGAITDVVS